LRAPHGHENREFGDVETASGGRLSGESGAGFPIASARGSGVLSLPIPGLSPWERRRPAGLCRLTDDSSRLSIQSDRRADPVPCSEPPLFLNAPTTMREPRGRFRHP
jgi:hypothetical protein